MRRAAPGTRARGAPRPGRATGAARGRPRGRPRYLAATERSGTARRRDGRTRSPAPSSGGTRRRTTAAYVAPCRRRAARARGRSRRRPPQCPRARPRPGAGSARRRRKNTVTRDRSRSSDDDDADREGGALVAHARILAAAGRLPSRDARSRRSHPTTSAAPPTRSGTRSTGPRRSARGASGRVSISRPSSSSAPARSRLAARSTGCGHCRRASASAA